MPFLQDLIHKFEVGGGVRYVRIGAATLVLLVLTLGYDLRAFKNMSAPEAMDAAQVGRNLAQGKGFSTLFIRPFSMFLVKRHNLQAHGPVDLAKNPDLAQVRTDHPDLANPPVYPLVLAGVMKVAPFDFNVSLTKKFWSSNGRFYRFQPDFLICLFNQLLFFATIVLAFFLARRLFDSGVAWISSLVLLGTELIWRFTASGLSTILVMLTFVALGWCLVLLEQEGREPKHGIGWLLGVALLTGVTMGVGTLTRYSFGWLMIPALVFVLLFGGNKRLLVALLMLVAFASLVGPWIGRNYAVSGTPFGVAGYTALENTFMFPGHRLERSLNPDLNQAFQMAAYWHKFFTNLRPMLLTELPKLAGSWVSAFFLVGLMIPFRNPATNRLRYFVLASLVLLAVVQILGQTQFSEDSPELNSENLLVLLTPFVLIFGVSLFYLLLDQLVLPMFQLRYLISGAFAVIVCLPMLLVFCPPSQNPVVFPPYYPPGIQTVGSWLKENELSMSDVPWAMAWYGKRQCVWLTLRATPEVQRERTYEDFNAISDLQKPIAALYLTAATTDKKLRTAFDSGDESWAGFVLRFALLQEVPSDFPLAKTPGTSGLPKPRPNDYKETVDWTELKFQRLENRTERIPDQLILTDWERWRKKA